MSSTAVGFSINKAWGVVFGRTILLIIYLITLISSLISIPARFKELATPYNSELYDLSRLTVQSLPDLGISLTTYATIAFASELLWVGVPIVIAALLFWRQPDNLFAQLSGVIVVTFTTTTIYLIDVLKPTMPVFHFVENGLQSFSLVGIVFFLYLFPNGRMTPRWPIVLGIIWSVFNLLWLIYPDMPGNYLHGSATWQNPLLAASLGFCAFGGGVLAQVQRYRSISTATERQQTKWIVLGLIVFYVGFVLRYIFFEQGNFDSTFRLGMTWAGSYMMLAFPLSFGAAIFRYRLWDIDLFVSRTLTYFTLLGLLLAVYLGVVLGIQTLVDTSSTLPSFVAAVFVAVLFQPLRSGLTQAASRYLFGDRDDPMRALTHLGLRLENVVDSAEIFPTIVDSITTSLRVPWAAIALRSGNTDNIVAQQGMPTGEPLKLPLSYQGHTVGELQVAQRTAADPFDARDLNLLQTVARQAGTAAHALQLTNDLRRSRQSLVTTREEERRRLRRDLHDGLGPTIAAQVLHIGAARQFLTKEPAFADELLAGLEKGLEGTLSEIRRVVYALRPPALDQLGLVGAVRDFTRVYQGKFELLLDMPEKSPAISAAAEVAAFRIIGTALDNVAQHAQASCCTLTLVLADNALEIEIVDDGVGISAEYKAGVGLTSMHERADELGGTFSIEPAKPRGTRLKITLPTNHLVNTESN